MHCWRMAVAGSPLPSPQPRLRPSVHWALSPQLIHDKVTESPDLHYLHLAHTQSDGGSSSWFQRCDSSSELAAISTVSWLLCNSAPGGYTPESQITDEKAGGGSVSDSSGLLGSDLRSPKSGRGRQSVPDASSTTGDGLASTSSAYGSSGGVYSDTPWYLRQTVRSHSARGASQQSTWCGSLGTHVHQQICQGLVLYMLNLAPVMWCPQAACISLRYYS